MTSKPQIPTEAPTTKIRVEDLIAKKDAEYPEDPVRNVCNGAEDPVTTRAGNSGCPGFGNFATLERKTRFSKQNGIARYEPTHSIKM
jgi:hypothetical protein